MNVPAPLVESQAPPGNTGLPPRRPSMHLLAALAVVLSLLTLAALLLAWTTQQRVKGLEQELVRRQADSQAQATEARVLAGAAQDLAREAGAKAALLEARVTEASVQRSQVEELLSTMSRSRDETVVADIEAALRVALQQSALTGNAEPLVVTLKQADERLARFTLPRLERVRRAVNRDLDRIKALGVVDIGSLALRLDEAVRLVDELPLVARAEPRAESRGKAAAPTRPQPAASAAGSTPAPVSANDDWRDRLSQAWQDIVRQVAGELRSLVRVTRIDHPEAMLVAPEQQLFVRENLKLRLLNARLALLSRQFDIAQSDLRDAQQALDRYFERGSKRVVAVGELMRQVSTQARQTAVPRPDDTLAALASAAAGR